MRALYQAWIRENVPENPAGKCREVTRRMREAFPELRRVRGHFLDVSGERPHWWLLDPDGDILDPTVSQFGLKGPPSPYRYLPRDEREPEPTGRCLECGELCFPPHGPEFCSLPCEYAFLRDLTNS